MNSAYHQVLRRAFRIAGESGERCRPVHLLIALAEAGGPISSALAPLAPTQRDRAQNNGAAASYLVMQTQQAARRFAEERGQAPGPAHLLLAVIDQAEPEAIASLTEAGLDVSVVRAAALEILGMPSDAARLSMPDPIPAGTMDRPPLPVGELDPGAWEALCWRQEHLPLRRLRRRSHYAALQHLESQAARRIAAQRGLDDDQRYSLVRHHRESVEELAASARPELVERRPAGPRAHGSFVTRSTAPQRWRHKWLGFTVGWGTWFSNRRVGLRNKWFELLTLSDDRGAPHG